jgi:hypothetical protein
MTTTKCALLVLVLVGIVLTGCGGSGGTIAGPINGPFGNSSLTGTFALSFSGVNTSGFLAVAGSIQANGSGTITGGVADINSGTGVFTNLPVTGTYTVHNNGQGNAALNTSAGTFDIDFVMVSTQRALVIRFDNNSTASGSLDAQTGSAFSNAALGGTFAFNLAGIDAGGHTFVSAGAIDPNGAGAIPSGVQDNNDNGTPSTNLPVTGSYSVGTNGRGTMTLNTSLGALRFAFYVVDANHFKMIEVDTAPVFAGDAFRQQFPQSNASLSGQLAFTLVGAASNGTPFVVGGVFSADGAGHVTSGTQDINSGGAVTQNIAITGTYSIGPDGRGILTTTGSNGATDFIIYPTTAGLQMVQVDSGEASSGAGLQQTGSFSVGSLQGNYGMNFSGVIGSGNQVDSIAQFSADGAGNLTGALDVNNAGALSANLRLTGTYSIASNGRGTATLQSDFGKQNLVLYTVNSTRVLFIEVDSNLLAVGEMEHQ